jgi:predicted nuclease of predicted toxin-antitoxin system
MNSLKFMIDANMPRLVMRNLNDLGYDTVDIRDIEKPGIDDDRIFELAQQEWVC